MEKQNFTIKKSRLVVLTGAGISAESGLGTFRGGNGLWDNHKIEDVASIEGFQKNPALVLDFYNMRRNQCQRVEPNAAHIGLAKLEKDYDVQIITQNIDDLHERAGSSQVLHLHGEIMKMRSVKNESILFPVNGEIQLGDLAKDGGQLRPDVVYFGEAVPKIEEAISLVEAADVFVLIGSSLSVYPAAGLIEWVGPNIPIYLMDTHIPTVPTRKKEIIKIEKPATLGIAELFQYLNV